MELGRPRYGLPKQRVSLREARARRPGQGRLRFVLSTNRLRKTTEIKVGLFDWPIGR
jgi:hypothetical protein